MTQTLYYLSVPKSNFAKETQVLKQKYGDNVFNDCFTCLTKNNFKPDNLLRETMNEIIENPYAVKNTLRVIIRGLYLGSFLVNTQNLSADLVSIMADKMLFNFSQRLGTFTNVSLTDQEENCTREIAVLISKLYLEVWNWNHTKSLHDLISIDQDNYLTKTFHRRHALMLMTEDTCKEINAMSLDKLMMMLERANWEDLDIYFCAA